MLMEPALRLQAEMTGLPGILDARAADAGQIACVRWQTLEDEIPAWDALAADASEPNPFFESWYLLPSLRHLPGAGSVRILRFDQDGKLAGLLPLVHAPRYYRWPVPHLASWLHANAFCGSPLVRCGSERAFWTALLGWADRHAGLGLFLHLRGIPLESPLNLALGEVLERQGREAAVVHRETRALLHSDLGADAYWEASLSGKKRKELRRQASRLAEEGEITFEHRTDAEGLPEWAAAFLALEASGWKGRAGSALASDAGTSALFRESLAGAAQRGRLERLALRLNGKPIAMLATFTAPPGAFSYKTAFAEDYARFSPGVLLQRENLAVLGRSDIAWTDSCASADHPMIDHIWRERREIGRLSIAMGGPLRRALFHHFVRAETARSPSGEET